MKASITDYLALCKLRVVALMILTTIIGMILASPTGLVPLGILIYGSLGIAMAACAGAVVNHVIDYRIDGIMARTKNRPIPSGRITPSRAIIMASILTLASMLVLFYFVNTTVAVLSLLTLIGYGGVYTLLLKRTTPQNIVIGGLAGAMPPLLGWTAITGQIDAVAWLLVLIIFTWTPPHFWSLAIYRYKEYEKAKIPMLPVTHGIPYTKRSILVYTLLMIASTYLPFVITMFGWVYCVGATLLNAGFLYQVLRLYRHKEPIYTLRSFRYSIFYLAALFIVMLIDHYFLVLA